MLLHNLVLAFWRTGYCLLMASEEGVMLLVKAQGNPNLLLIILLSIVVRTALLSLAQQLKQNNNNHNNDKNKNRTQTGSLETLPAVSNPCDTLY